MLREAENLRDVPVYALGASSGGAFVLLLPFHMQLQVHTLVQSCWAAIDPDRCLWTQVQCLCMVQGVVVQVMGVPSQLWLEHLPDLKWPYPPAAFVHMPRDTRRAANGGASHSWFSCSTEVHPYIQHTANAQASCYSAGRLMW